jgi:hydroxymethylbilane synthase
VTTLRLGTRGSALALAQSRLVAEALTAATGTTVELVEIVTAGDRSAAPIPQLGVGVFVSALRDAVLAKEIDFAVHSYKDLPTAPTDDLVIAAIPERADPRDVLIARDGLTLAQLPAGSRVGTGALRRVAQLGSVRPDLTVEPIRGNVDTRLRKVASGGFDAVVLAYAGLRRLGREGEVSEILDPAVMLPAPAQGALAVECRVGEPTILEALSVLDHEPTRAAVTAERALLSTLEAGCSAPVASLAEAGDGSAPTIYLRGAVFSPDGRVALRRSRSGAHTDAYELGRLLAQDLLDAGATDVMECPNDPHP